MRQINRVMVIAAFLLSNILFILPQHVNAQDFSISRHRIAGLQITPETTVLDIYAEFGQNNVQMANTHPEGSPVPTVFVFLDGKKAIEGFINSLDSSSKLQSGLGVFDDRFVTDRGIHVGSTVGELKKQYSINEVVTGEAVSKHAICREAEMTFQLQPRYKMPSGSIENIPDDVQIICIFVWPQRDDN